MNPVPGWFRRVCWFVAVALSLGVGLQYGAEDSRRWAALLAGAAVATAALPPRRIVAAAAAGVGVIAGLWAAWLIHRGAPFDASGLAQARGASAATLISLWLLAASMLRALWA